jgi:TetR/AcrR family transcriptional regulator, cholesterol catabolism regulator
MGFREEIKREAIGLFFKMGVKNVRMDTIAQRLKVSKRTIYENFKNKDSLIREAIDLSQKEQNEIHEKIVSESGNVIEAVLSLLKNGSEMLSGINPRYYADLQRLYPGIWNEKIRQSKLHSHQLIRDLLKKGIHEGIYREDINEEIISLILIEQLYMLLDEKILPTGEFSIVEVYENIIITMTRGLATPKGLKLLENYQQHASHL